MNRTLFLCPGVVFLWLAASLAVPLGASFIVNNNGTVTDPATGLMWDRCSWGQTFNPINPALPACVGTATTIATTHDWGSALSVAITANESVHRTYADWRLPSRTELESLVDITKWVDITNATGSAIDTTAFPGTPFAVYWSSTVYAPDPSVAWGVSFASGGTGASFQSGNHHVRLVRSIQSFDALAPPCGDGLKVVAEQWAMLSVPCIPAAPATPSSTFETGAAGGLVPGTYNTSAGWTLFDWLAHEPSPSYRRLLAGDALQPGPGYWFFGFPRVFPSEFDRLQVIGSGTPSDVPYGSACPSLLGCKAIALHTPGGERLNLVGNPFPHPIRWADVRVRVNGTSIYTPSEALIANIMSNQLWVWTGTQYATFSDITPGMEGALAYFMAFWVQVLEGAAGQTVELLIPAGEILGGLIAPEPEVLAATAPPTPRNLGWLDWLLPAAQASEPPRGRGPMDPPPGWSRVPATVPGQSPWNATFETLTAEQQARGLSRRDAEHAAHQQALQEGRQWYVRLKVDDPATGRKDHNNVLGQLLNASDGSDPHDLVLLPPFASPYLTLLFPRPDWGVRAGDYASDYRSTSAELPIEWTFEIRADPPGSEVILRWEGNPEILHRSRLLDHATGRTVQPTGPQHQDGYPATLIEGTRAFTWTYLGPTGRESAPSRHH
jgi:hypothetical protein